MSLDKNDVGVLVYIAQRERPIGAPKWDEAGIAAHLNRLADRGFGFGELLDRVIAHARDRSAKTPGVLMHPAATRAAEPTTPRHPARTEQCPGCGLRRAACVCDPKVQRRPVVDSRTEGVQNELGRARQAIAAARSSS